jgi:hypothetical protein
MELGLDSLSAVQFARQLENVLPTVQFTGTLIFDFPSIERIVEHII